MSSRLQSDSLATKAVADLTTYQNRFVAISSTGVNICTSGAAMLGILENAPDINEAAEVSTINGMTTKLVIGAVLSAGQALKSGSDGKGIAAGTDKDRVGAILLEAATADGDICEVLIQRYDIAV